MAKLVSNIYGDALFEVAVENGTIDSMLEEVEAVLDIFQENEEYVKLLNHPKIPVEEKISCSKEHLKERFQTKSWDFSVQ